MSKHFEEPQPNLPIPTPEPIQKKSAVKKERKEKTKPDQSSAMTIPVQPPLTTSTPAPFVNPDATSHKKRGRKAKEEPVTVFTHKQASKPAKEEDTPRRRLTETKLHALQQAAMKIVSATSRTPTSSEKVLEKKLKAAEKHLEALKNL